MTTFTTQVYEFPEAVYELAQRVDAIRRFLRAERLLNKLIDTLYELDLISMEANERTFNCDTKLF